jgi:hypothetical protein
MTSNFGAAPPRVYLGRTAQQMMALESSSKSSFVAQDASTTITLVQILPCFQLRRYL